MEALSERSNFIVKSKLKDLRDAGGIFDSNMRVLAYFRHEHTWRTPRGPIKIGKQARATDIYLESFDGNLFGEINEIPPKLVSMRLIRTFEIYNDNKELVGVVREKPKALGSDWVLENLEEKVIAFMVGDRKKKDYEIQTPDGEFLARCFRDSSLDKDSYKIEMRSVGGGVELFLLLCYIVVLDLAETGWTAREGFVDLKMEKEHLAKRRLAETQTAEIRASKSFSGYVYRNTVLSIVQAGLLFALSTMSLATGSGVRTLSVFLYPLGIAILTNAFIIVAKAKKGQFHKFAKIMNNLGLASLVILSFTLTQIGFGFEPLPNEIIGTTVAAFILGFAILANGWLANWWSLSARATRTGYAEEEKDHLMKTQVTKTPTVKTRASEPISVYAIRNAVLGAGQTVIVFTLATMFFGQGFLSFILFAFGIAISVTAFMGVTLVKLNQFNAVSRLMGVFAVLSLFIGAIMFQGVFGLLTFESAILVFAMFIVGFGILVNLWLSIGLFG